MSDNETQEYENAVTLYDKLIATYPDIERKGKTMPYTSLNGNMFTYLSKSGTLGIRLGADEREAFLEKYETTLFESHGAVMKEYVTVPSELLQKTAELQPYLDKSYAYAQTLKPKATTKKKKKG